MRKFLSSTAGASFNQEVGKQTICVRKDCVELIYKVNAVGMQINEILVSIDGLQRTGYGNICKDKRTF